MQDYQNKKYLLIAPYFSEGSTSLFVVKALSDLGLYFKVVAPRIQPIPVEKFDITIVWCNRVPARYLPESYKILCYIDDPEWWKDNQVNALKLIKIGYDKVLTISEIEGYPTHPMGCDTDMHKNLNTDKNSDVAFIGTLRDQGRHDLVFDFIELIKKTPLKFRIYGNGWEHQIFKNYWVGKCAYHEAFVNVCNTTRIIFQQHFSNYTSTKDFEVPCCGSCLYIIDEKATHTKKIYPMAPTYKDANELLSKCQYFLSHWQEAQEIIAQMQKIAQEYTYTKQIKKMLEQLS